MWMTTQNIRVSEVWDWLLLLFMPVSFTLIGVELKIIHKPADLLITRTGLKWIASSCCFNIIPGSVCFL